MLRSLKGLLHLFVAIAANMWFRFPSRKLTVIGVTGTDGKTTTVSLVYEILKAAGLKASMISSVHAVIAGKKYDTGFHVTTPNAWWVQKFLRQAVDHGDSHFVLEVTSHALDQYRVFGVRFAVGLLTNVTYEHLDWHTTFAEYLATKLKLIKAARVAVVNRDDVNSYPKALPYLVQKDYVTYGILRDAKVNPKTHPFKTKLPGVFNRYNCLAALSVAYVLGIDQRIARSVILNFTGVSGRMEVLVEKPFTVIVDFAHTPNAIEQVLKTVRPMTKKRLIHVFGAAGMRDHSKRPLMGKASSTYADEVILTEEDYRSENVETIMDEIATGVDRGKPVHRFPLRADAINYALGQAKPGDLVIITGKGHEKSLCRGTTEYPWSDQREVKKVLHARNIAYA